MKFLILILPIIFLSACRVAGIKDDKTKTTETPVYVGLGGEKVPNSALINGSLFLQQGLSSAPLTNVEVRLLNKAGKPIAVTMSTPGGAFAFQKPLKGGWYRLEVNNKKYKGALPIEFVNKNVENLQFFVEEVRKP